MSETPPEFRLLLALLYGIVNAVRALIRLGGAFVRSFRNAFNSKHGVNVGMAITFVLSWYYFIQMWEPPNGFVYGWIVALMLTLIAGLLWPWLFFLLVIGLSAAFIMQGPQGNGWDAPPDDQGQVERPEH